MGMSESSSVRDSSAAQDPASRANEQQERAPATRTFESAFAGVQTGSFNTIDELLASFQNYLLLIANRELGGGLDARFATSDIVRQTVEQARQDIGGFAGQSQEELMAWLVKILASRIAKAKGTATTDQRPVVLEPDQPLSPAPGSSANSSAVTLQCPAPFEPASIDTGGTVGNQPSDTAASAPAPIDLRIGRFQIIRELGRGGHAIVFLALDPILRRTIALKVPRPEILFTPAMQDRFLREARTVASLDHANILKVFEAGAAGGICYIAEEYCAGPSLWRWLCAQKSDVNPRHAALLVAQLADGIDHAHSQGVLHRDLKPDNILLDPTAVESTIRKKPPGSNGAVTPDATVSDLPFRAKLADFGIAKVFDEEDRLTATGAVIGTASYMPPEQATGQTQAIGPPSDVYGLGAILYELLTRRAPFKSDSCADTLRKVVSEEAPTVRSLRPDVPRDLEAICLKCLEKRPTDRYRTAADLAADLRRYLDGEPVTARPANSLRRAMKVYRRQNFVVKVLLPVLVVAWSVSLAGLWLYMRLVDTTPTSYRKPPPSTEPDLFSDIRAAFNIWRENNERLRDNPNAGEEMEAILARDIPGPGQSDRRGFDWYYLWRLCHPAETVGALPRIATLKGHTADAYFVSFSRDGSRVASASRDRTARVWDVATGKVICVCSGHTNDVNWVDFSPDQTLLATASDDHTIKIWDASTGKEKFTLVGHQSEVVGALFCPTGRTLVSGDNKGTLIQWDLDSRKAIQSVPTHLQKRIQALSWADEGHLLATTGDDERIRIWQMPKMDFRGDHHIGSAHTAALSRNGRWVASGGGGTITVEDVVGGGRRATFAGHFDHIESVRFSPDGNQLASCGGDGVLRLWDLATRRGWMAAPKHAVGLWCVAYSNDGMKLATSARDGLIEIWDTSVTPRWTVVRKDGPDRVASAITFSPDSRRLAVTHVAKNAADGGVQILDVSGRNPSVLVDRQGANTFSATFSNDGGELAVSCPGQIECLDSQTLQPRLKIPLGSARAATQLTYNADHSLLVLEGPVSKDDQCTVHLYDSLTGAESKKFEQVIPNQEGLAVTPGKDLLAVSWNRNESPMVSLYELPSGRVRAKAIGHRGWHHHAAFSPTQPILALAANGGVELWNTGSLKEVGFLSDLSRETGPLAFSADGRLLVVAVREYNSVQLWDVARRKRLFALPLPEPPALHTIKCLLAVSADGKKIACSVTDSAGHGSVFLFSGLAPETVMPQASAIDFETEAASGRN